MTLTTGGALFATLFANFLYALWYQSLKHLKDYPLAGFVLWLYISSFLTIGTATLVLGPKDMPSGILAELSGKWGLAAIVILGGAVMAWGLIMSLVHMKKNGMVANQAISGAVGTILSLILSFVVGGMPARISLPLVLVAAVVIILASVLCQYSTALKRKNIRENGAETAEKGDSVLKQNVVLIISMVLIMGYSVSYMMGTRTETRPDGFPPLLCVLLLVIGSLFGTAVYSLISLTRSHQLRQAFWPKNKLPIVLALGSGICHYGGNLLLIYALPLVSAPISLLLSKTTSIWTYGWGILYGEYKGTSKKAKITLAVGIGVFVAGVLMLTYALYF